jgi:hypothetical protein
MVRRRGPVSFDPEPQPLVPSTSVAVRVRLSLMVMLGMLAMAVAIGALMFVTANTSFVKQARADVERQSQAVASEIDNLTDAPRASLLVARQDLGFDRFYEADESAETERAAALVQIQHTILYPQRVFAIDEICGSRLNAPSPQGSTCVALTRDVYSLSVSVVRLMLRATCNRRPADLNIYGFG